MRYIGMFFDSSYRPCGDVFTEGEFFKSLEDAKRKFRDRYEFGWRSTVNLPDFDEDGKFIGVAISHMSLFPSVTEAAEIQLYAIGKDGRVCDDYPDRLLRIGPLGGVRVESC